MRAVTSYFYVLLVLRGVANGRQTIDGSPTTKAPPQRRLFLLDVDATLYNERSAGIEAQIVANTHQYCQEELGISADQADNLFRSHGSTVEGLRQTVWGDLTVEERKDRLFNFYQKVYKNIDMTSLLDVQRFLREGSTGYSHHHGDQQQELRLLCQLLQASPYPLAIASNSPSWHVDKVLRCLGMKDISIQPILTPDSSAPATEGYPTKHDPSSFFGGRLIDSSIDEVLFFDDSKTNLDRVAASNLKDIIEPIPVDNNGASSKLSHGLLRSLGLVDPSYQFNATLYLQAKNIVDSQSIHPDTWNLVISKLRDQIQQQKTISIVDVGAGRLNILALFLQGQTSAGLNALFGHTKNEWMVSYTAYESNPDLLAACEATLQTLGFELVDNPNSGEFIFTNHKNWTVKLLMRDFDNPADDDSFMDTSTPDLIIGCCFADLSNPHELVPSLLRNFRLLESSRSSSHPTLMYFPITFSGQTMFLPPRPFEEGPMHGRNIPSDTFAFQTYSKALSKNLGHNLDPNLLVYVMSKYGVSLLSSSPSNWIIDPDINPYLLNTMLYFFGTTAGPSLLEEGLDAAGWIQRARSDRSRIHVSNVDLLFQVDHTTSITDNPEVEVLDQDPQYLEELQFIAPETVTSVKKSIPELGPKEVLIESTYSLISSGTELKVFKGNFEDAALDVNIDGMQEERMTYPLAYGYCLVGKIIKCGSEVSKEDYLGRLVFTFAAHASHVVSSVDSIQVVPQGISARDAIFMPSVETAISIVHDAHVRAGENVAVYGQGLIGLLVTAILSMNSHAVTHSGKFGVITTFDTIPDRLAVSSSMGSTQALFPGGAKGPFDVTIEVSGNGRALQSAIDSTVDGGRIIVGSWYGSGRVPLQLGMDFHRSHKTIQTSQVSEIPATVSGLWTKERRFSLAWELVRILRPSRLLSKTASLRDAMQVYQELAEGSELGIAFSYE